MFVTYAPAEGDEQRWEFHAGRVLDVEAEACERAFGDTWDTFLVQVLKGGMRARRVLLWHLIKTQHPNLKFADLESFRVDELTVEYDKGELQQIRDNLAAAKVDDATREVMQSYLDSEIENAPEGSNTGKARSKRSASSTASRSPAS